MPKRQRSQYPSIAYALGVHGALFGLLTFTLDWKTEPAVNPAESVIQSTVVSNDLVQQEFERLKSIEDAKRAQEQERLAALEREADALAQQREQEAAKLNELEQQRLAQQEDYKREQLETEQRLANMRDEQSSLAERLENLQASRKEATRELEQEQARLRA